MPIRAKHKLTGPDEGGTEMTLTDADRLTIVKLLAGGRDVEFVADAVGMDVDHVKIAASSRGYPDVDKLTKAVGILQRKVDAAELNGLPPTSSAETKFPPTPRPRRANSPHQAAAKKPGRQFDATEHLLTRGGKSPKARTRNLADKIGTLLEDLRDRLDAEDAERREAEKREKDRQAAVAEVRELEDQLKAARAKLRKYKNTRGGNGRAKVTRAPSPESRVPGGKAAQQALDYDAKAIRTWARENGVDCPARGRFLPREVVDAWREATGSESS